MTLISLGKLLAPARKAKKLRDAYAVARAARHYAQKNVQEKRAARQFVHSIPSTVEMPLDEFRIQNPETVYTRVNGAVAGVHKRVINPALPESHSNVRTAAMPAVHDYFDRPSENVLVCVRRQRRRRVLFAMRLTRKGANQRQRKWTKTSKIRCV